MNINHSIFRACLCLSVLVCAFALLPVLAADPVTITPVWIHDGDTFQAHLINKAFLNCRIWGIDAPELDQPWGKVSKAVFFKHSPTTYIASQSVQACGGVRKR